MSAIIVGVAPGPITGIAVLTYTEAVLTEKFLLQLGHTDRVAWIVEQLLNSAAAENVVLAVASYATRSGTHPAGRIARQVTDVLYDLGEYLGVETHVRTSQKVKPWARLARLDGAGLIAATKGLPYARDAAAHALYAAVNDCDIPDPMPLRLARTGA